MSTIETEFFSLESPITGEVWQVYPEEVGLSASVVEGCSDEEFAEIVHLFVGREELVGFFRKIEGFKAEELKPWDEYPDLGDACAGMEWLECASLDEDEFEFDGETLSETDDRED